MSLQGTRTVYNSGVPIWQTMLETAQGGFKLDVTGLPIGAILPKGTAMAYDESTRVAKPVLTAVVYEATSGTTVKLKKGSLLAVQSKKVSPAVGGTSYTVSSVDASNADYDVIVTSTALGTLNPGDVLFESTASGATAGALAATPRGLLYDDVEIAEGNACSVCIRGTVYERRIPGVPQAVKNAIPSILFSQSY